MTFIYILLFLFFAFIVCVIILYNKLISKNNQVENMIGSIDAVLKKRYDLIPNLVSTVQEFMKHETKLLKEVTELRTKSKKTNLSGAERVKLDKEMSSALSSFMISVESYPDLKSNENVLHLQQTLHEVEGHISAARRSYNQAITDYNDSIEMFPSNIVAKYLNYKRKEVFFIDETEKNNVNIKNLFK